MSERISHKLLENTFKFFCSQVGITYAEGYNDIGAFYIQRGNGRYSIQRGTVNGAYVSNPYDFRNYTAGELDAAMRFAVKTLDAIKLDGKISARVLYDTFRASTLNYTFANLSVWHVSKNNDFADQYTLLLGDKGQYQLPVTGDTLVSLKKDETNE